MDIAEITDNEKDLQYILKIMKSTKKNEYLHYVNK